jgi:hypothetical protein
MYQDIENRRKEGQKLEDENMDFMNMLHLYAPGNLLHACQSLQTYCILLSILFSDQSILYQGVKFIWAILKHNQLVFKRSLNQPQLIAMVPYAMDVAVQMLLTDISDPLIPLTP